MSETIAADVREVDPPEGVIRPLMPTENAIYLDHLLRLDPLSRFSRFGGPTSDNALRRHAARAAAAGATLIGYFEKTILRGVAELHPVVTLPGKPRVAEAAFSVEREWQGKGVGSALMRHLVRYAQNRGIEHLQIMFLASNGRMKRIVVHHTDDLDVAENEVISCVRPPRATPFSWLREVMDGAFSVIHTFVDLRARLLPPPLRGQ
ncbi:GNAT family N-acetyltransferase [Bosea sp. 117]|uniref:GNAT family N-acetyltransferase n=1 Tax=Bosea sp. 117 TaxID=1125973 RepID=UPI0018CC1FC2|nr:GNAT family N-acetyltransferase [Bosea sp. 117]